jgi:non-lysosomal glucosylceramidase
MTMWKNVAVNFSRALPRTRRHVDWPVLRRFDGDRLAQVQLPLGGIGTGTIGLGGRGDLRSWEIRNQPAYHVRPAVGFFAVHVHDDRHLRETRLLESALSAPEVSGPFGSPVPAGGLPRFESAVFEAAYPLAQVSLHDPTVPLGVTLEAFNPLVPADAELSGIPAAVLRYRIANQHDRALSVAVCGASTTSRVQAA